MEKFVQLHCQYWLKSIFCMFSSSSSVSPLTKQNKEIDFLLTTSLKIEIAGQLNLTKDNSIPPWDRENLLQFSSKTSFQKKTSQAQILCTPLVYHNNSIHVQHDYNTIAWMSTAGHISCKKRTEVFSFLLMYCITRNPKLSAATCKTASGGLCGLERPQRSHFVTSLISKEALHTVVNNQFYLKNWTFY